MTMPINFSSFRVYARLLTTIERNGKGDDPTATCARMGVITDHIHSSDDLPTDRYMAIEGTNGLVATISDALSLKPARDKALPPPLLLQTRRGEG